MRDHLINLLLLVAVAAASLALVLVRDPMAAAFAAVTCLMLFAALMLLTWSGRPRDGDRYLL